MSSDEHIYTAYIDNHNIHRNTHARANVSINFGYPLNPMNNNGFIYSLFKCAWCVLVRYVIAYMNLRLYCVYLFENSTFKTVKIEPGHLHFERIRRQWLAFRGLVSLIPNNMTVITPREEYDARNILNRNSTMSHRLCFIILI